MPKRKPSQRTEHSESSVMQERHVPLDWQIPDGIITRHVTNIVVQRGEHEVIISFFEVKPPIMLGDSEEVQEQLTTLKSVPAVCVSRIVVSTNRLPGFVQALQIALEAVKANNGVSDWGKE